MRNIDATAEKGRKVLTERNDFHLNYYYELTEDIGPGLTPSQAAAIYEAIVKAFYLGAGIGYTQATNEAKKERARK